MKMMSAKSIRQFKTDYPVEYRTSNPKLDFYDADGKYLGSSCWYRSVRHAWKHAKDNVAHIVKGIQ